MLPFLRSSVREHGGSLAFSSSQRQTCRSSVLFGDEHSAVLRCAAEWGLGCGGAVLSATLLFLHDAAQSHEQLDELVALALDLTGASGVPPQAVGKLIVLAGSSP